MRITLSRTFPCLVIVFLCSLIAQDVLGVTYYVDPATGSDSAAGVKTSPWKTIAKAKTSVKAGDIVYLRPGTYGSVKFGETGDRFGTSGNYITYANDPESAPYSAKFSYIGFTGAHDYYIRIKGFEVYAPSPARRGIEVAGIDEQKLARYIVIEDCKAHGNRGSANVADGPSDACFYIRKAGNTLLENCEAYYSGGTDGDGIDVFGGGNVTIRSCRIHDALGAGINFGGDGPYLAEYNIIHDQRPEWGPPYPSNPHGSGVTVRSHNTTLRGNTIYNYGNTRPIRWYQDENLSDSWSLEYGYHDCLVEDNLIFRTDDFTGTMWWFEVVDAGENFIVRNNTFATGAQIHLAKYADGSGLSFYNNIVPSSFTLNNWGTYYSGGSTALKAQTCEQARSKWNNVKEGGNIYGSLVAVGNGYQCSYSSFSTTSSSQVGGSFAVGTFFASGAAVYPFASGHPYQLAAGSPAIGFADKAHATSTDILKHARDASPDAGCHEYGASGGGTPQNQPPVFDTIGNKTIEAGSTLAFSIKATDPEGKSVTYGVTALPANATFSGTSFVWTPTSAQVGSHTVGFVASDGERSVTKLVQIVVTKKEVVPADPTYFTLTTYSDNGVVACNPAATGYALNQNVTLAATPYRGYKFTGWTGDLTNTANPLTITITGNTTLRAVFAVQNTAPVFAAVADKTVGAGTLLTFKVQAVDAQGNPVTYSAQNLPAGASFVGNTFSWTPQTAGTYTVGFTASDGTATSSIAVKITVHADAPDGLVLWMQLDDTPSDGILDSSTYGNNGTSTKLPAMVSGYFKNAYLFDGVDDFVSVPDSASLDATQVTLGAWIYVKAYKDDQRIVSKETGTTSPYSVYTLLLSGAGEERLELRLGINGAREAITSNANIPLNTWTHVAATYDGLKAVLYVNGKADKSASITGAIQVNDKPVFIGASQFYGRVFSGAIDDVVIYNRALSTSDIAVLMQANNNAPVLAANPDAEVTAGTLLTFQLSGSDVDGDVLSYSAASMPAGAALTGSTFTWTPVASQVGVYTVIFTVSDGELSSSQAVAITVNKAVEKVPDDSRLVLHMAFEDSPADGVLDSSAYMNNGLVAAGSIPAWTYGYLTFDGVNDYVKVPASASLPDDKITISAWVYLNSYKDDQVIVAKEYGAASPYSSYRLGLGAYSESRKLQMRLGTSGTRKVIISASDIPLNQWTHVACVYNRSTVTLYINGAVDSVRKYVYGAITLSGNPLYVGMGQYDNTYFAGLIDEVRIYNAALSESEIAALAQN